METRKTKPKKAAPRPKRQRKGKKKPEDAAKKE
jgi:hypothetical protein